MTLTIIDFNDAASLDAVSDSARFTFADNYAEDGMIFDAINYSHYHLGYEDPSVLTDIIMGVPGIDAAQQPRNLSPHADDAVIQLTYDPNNDGMPDLFDLRSIQVLSGSLNVRVTNVSGGTELIENLTVGIHNSLPGANNLIQATLEGTGVGGVFTVDNIAFEASPTPPPPPPPSQLFGTNNDDQIVGTDGDNTIFGRGGDDEIFGLGGLDIIDAGDGNDEVFGGEGGDPDRAETLLGRAGNDLLSGEQGTDALFGEQGDDTLLGGSEKDFLFGGVGDDRLFGNSGADELNGGEGHDQLFGGQGNDLLGGGNGNDELFGGSGDDRLGGGAGRDELSGGSGHDRFDYSLLVGTGVGGADTIMDFEASMDQIFIFGPPGRNGVNTDGNDVIDARDGPVSLVGGNLTIDVGTPPLRPELTGNTLTVVGVAELHIGTDIVFA